MSLQRPGLIMVLLTAALLSGHPLCAQESYPLSYLRDTCIELPGISIGGAPEEARDCAVSEFGRFAGLEGEELYYALYCLIPGYAEAGSNCHNDDFTANYHRSRALAIFSKPPAEENLIPLWTRAEPEIGMLIYARPEVIESAYGTLLVMPIRVDGTGGGNESEYYLRQGSGWRRLDTQSWLEELRQQIPAGLGMWHGVWPDLRTMTATTGLYRPEDANCCPTGGEVQIRLAIEGDRLAIRELAIIPPP